MRHRSSLGSSRSFTVACTIAVSLAGCRPQSSRVDPPTTPAPQAQTDLPPGAGDEAPIAKEEAPVTIAPMRLTASDGTGLRLTRVRSRGVVRDPIAFTEVSLTFDNPHDRVLEGTFSMRLPDGASISRFAMKIGETWQEGEVVEKKHAREAYEDFLHRKQDPALLEQGAGNEFTARVFPIPAHGTKEIRVAYVQEVTTDAPYVVPLRGLPAVDDLDASVTIGDGRAAPASVKDQGRAPASDLVWRPLPATRPVALRSGDLVVTRVRAASAGDDAPYKSTIVLFDTSASRALDFDAQLARLTGVVRELGKSAQPDATLTVAAFDQAVAVAYEGSPRGFGDDSVASLKRRGALGASDVAGALSWAAARAKEHPASRVLLVSDGVATAGGTGAAAMRQALAKVGSAGIARVDAIAVGGLRDAANLHHLVAGALREDGVVVDGAEPAAAIARRLLKGTRSNVAVRVDGSTWSWPTRFDGLQRGDERVVYAVVPHDAASPVSVSLGDATAARADEAPAERPLVERALAQARIASLLDREGTPEAPTDLRKQVVDLAVKNRVTTPYTSFLVLETEEDYARFAIDRRSLRDVLVLEDGHVAAGKRVASAPTEKTNGAAPRALESDHAPRLTPPPEPSKDDPVVPRGDLMREAASFGMIGLAGVGAGGGGAGMAAAPSSDREGGTGTRARGEEGGMGSIGTIGHGSGTASSSGFGSGHGSLSGSHASSTPVLRQGATQVSGRLPPEVIQRIVRQNFGRMRLCYERGLSGQPDLQGRVAVRFTIEPDGSVGQASNGGSDLPDAAVVACVVHAFEGLSFPSPEGGRVQVTYPISFAPGGAEEASREAQGPPKAAPYEGAFKAVMDALARADKPGALRLATKWRGEQPGDVLALVALGEALEASGSADEAARAYGSLIDLFPSRADLRRYAGERLEHVANRRGLELAVDTFEKAAEERPDHPSSHRLLAFARLRRGEYAAAFDTLVAGIAHHYPDGRFLGVDRVLREDLGLVAAAWSKAEPDRRAAILSRVEQAGGTVEDGPSLRFVLQWETDANDVDLHVYDAAGGHAFFQQKTLASGGELYADVTTGFGPECFTVRAAKGARSGPYKVQAHYYARGPMGYGMGTLQAIEHDGHGGLTFGERPFVVMTDHAYVDLGTYGR